MKTKLLITVTVFVIFMMIGSSLISCSNEKSVTNTDLEIDIDSNYLDMTNEVDPNDDQRDPGTDPGSEFIDPDLGDLNDP